MNLNKVFIAGRVTAKPELRQSKGGQSVTSFGVAVNRAWTDKQGQKQEDVQFFNVVFWGKSAETVAQYFSKGQVILVEGRLSNRDWETKDGQKRQSVEIIGERFQFGPKPMGKPAPKAKVTAESDELPDINVDEGDVGPENIPF